MLLDFFNVLNLSWGDFKEIISNNKNNKKDVKKNYYERPDDQNV